ncbi:hypothetical protein AURDEDRAFT_137608 [Auricularia subglabra TFB-10046 SS5]|nr:hypothetical protein AURDEDRAFT_137608 [Auricularia subglabra TFB-10046 SS5]
MSSPPPTTDDLLPRLMTAIMRDIASIIAQSVLYGTYLIVFSVASYNFLKRRNVQRFALAFAAITLATFTISTFLWASNIAVLVQRLDLVFVHTDENILVRIKQANVSTAKMRYMSDVMFVVSYLIGDAIIAWRILVLSQWVLWTTILMFVLWLGSFATGFGLIGCLVHADFALTGDLPQLCTNLENSSWVISLVFNGMATLLLARIAWASNMTDASKKSKVKRVLHVLVVSGCIYFLLGLPRLTSFANPSLNPLPSNVSYATQIIEAMLYQLVGLYPTAVTAFLFYESKTGTSMFNQSKTMTPGNPYAYPGATTVVMMGSGYKHSSSDEVIHKV